MIRDSIVGIALGAILTVVSYGIGWHFGWITGFSYLEFFGVLFNFACVYLATQQKVASWPMGIIACVILGIFFWNLSLYSSMVLSLFYFLPIQVWGWWNWMYGGENKTELPVSWIPINLYPAIIGVGLAGWAVTTYINSYFNSPAPGLDTAILVISIVAQWLIGRKNPECWALWIAVNVLSVYVYGSTGAMLLAAQYLLFLGNAFLGLYSWSMELIRNRKFANV